MKLGDLMKNPKSGRLPAGETRPKKVVAVVPQEAWDWLMNDMYMTAESSSADESYRQEQKRALAKIRYEYVSEAEARQVEAILRAYDRRLREEGVRR